MQRVIEAVVDEFSRLIQCVGEFKPNGALQARADVMALEATFGAFSTGETSAALKEARDCLPALTDRSVLLTTQYTFFNIKRPGASNNTS